MTELLTADAKEFASNEADINSKESWDVSAWRCYCGTRPPTGGPAEPGSLQSADPWTRVLSWSFAAALQRCHAKLVNHLQPHGRPALMSRAHKGETLF